MRVFLPKTALALSATLALSACAAAGLGDAAELSSAGSQASTKLLGASQTVESAFRSSVTDDRFLVALQSSAVPNGTGCSLMNSGPASPGSARPSGIPKASIDRIEAALHARTELAAGLGKTYSAMNALATYDAGGAVESGLTDVFGATNTLRENVGLAPVSNSLTTVVPILGGALVQHRQLVRLKRASARIRLALGYYKEALEHGRSGTVSTVKDSIGETYALQIALWRRGYLDANGFLADAGESSGLTVPTADNVRLTAADPALCAGVRAALEGKRDELRDAVADEYDAQIDIVEELIVAHEKFEKGAPVDAAHLAALLSRLTEIAQKIGGKKDAS